MLAAMPLGSSKSLIDPRRGARAYRRLFGSEEMHSHFRWAAIKPYIDFNARHTLEVGGGDGWVTFEVAEHNKNPMVATEFEQEKVDEARRIAELGGFANVEVSQKDLRQLGAETTFDQVLAIDVLEHIDDDELAIRQIADALVPGGRLVISVPTPRYPETFGRQFADRLGHVRDGYWLEDLQPKLTAAGLQVTASRYYTLKWVSRACRLFYGRGIPYTIGVLWAPIARPVLRATERRHQDKAHASSLALLAVKQ